MNNTLRLRWPQAEPGSESARYVHTLKTRLHELGVQLADSASENVHERSLFDGAGTGKLPLISAIDSIVTGAGTALACRPDPAALTVIAFSADTPDEAEWRILAEICAELARLSPWPLHFVVFASPACHAIAKNYGLACRTLDDPKTPCLLFAADAALISPSPTRQNQLLAAGLGIPTLLHLPDEAPAPSDGILAAAGATPRQLAGLLLLLAIEPGVRRKALDAQEPLRLAQSSAAQRSAVAAWLAEQGIEPSFDFSKEALPAAATWRVEGVFDSSYSLAIVNRRLALALSDAGERVSLYTYEQGENPQPAWHAVEEPERMQEMWQLGKLPHHPAVSLRNAWPPVVRDMRARRRVLASYAWEETAFPVAFANEFNFTLDLITVVSRQTAQILRDAGISTPMAVVGNGVDHLLGISPEPLPRALPAARFRFLHISSCFPRKGVDILLKSYGNAFDINDDVALIIKTFPNPHNDVAEQLKHLRHGNPRYPHVELIEDDWTPGQIASLYQSCHALVAPSRGEGFGLPIAEAILYRLPVIVTGWGGHLDFCTEENAWLINYTLQYADTHLGLANSLWAEPDDAHLTELLQALPTLQESTRLAKIERARAYMLDHYTWQQVAARTRAALAALDARPGLPPPLRVGWLTTWGSRCGIAAYSQHMVGAFSNDELYIFAPAGEESPLADAPNVHRNWTLGASSLGKLIADVRELTLDALVVQHHWGFFSLDALVQLIDAMNAVGTRVIIDFHNTRSAPPAVCEPAVLQALASTERLLVHTLDDMQRLAALGLSAKLTLFPLAVYPVVQPETDSIDAARKRLGLGNRRVVASYGFLLPHKGLAQLIEAMPALLAAQPNLHLLMVNAIYSPERSGPEQRRLLELIVDLGLGDRVTLITDFLPETECLTLLKTADLIVFPYQNSEESSSAAVRMALAADRLTAVTPLAIFADVASVVATLPGIDSASLAAGLAELLSAGGSAYPAEAQARRAEFIDASSAERLSQRLRGIILGRLAEIKLEPSLELPC